MPGQSARENGKKGGRPVGSISEATMEKQEAREFIRKRVRAALAPMVDAQILHCQGVSYMRLRNPDGSFARATDEKQIDAAIAAGASWFQIFTEAPNTQAFVALSDRAFDKPTEHHEHSGPEGGPLEYTDVLKQRHARHRAPQS